MSKNYFKKPFIEYLREMTLRKTQNKWLDNENLNKEIDAKLIFDLLASNIRELRKMRGFTINRLAKESKLSYVYLQSIEKGKKNVSMKIIDNIAKTLGVTAQILLSPNIDAYRISKLFEVNGRLKRYSPKQLIHMEQLIENLDRIMAIETDIERT